MHVRFTDGMVRTIRKQMESTHGVFSQGECWNISNCFSNYHECLHATWSRCVQEINRSDVVAYVR